MMAMGLDVTVERFVETGNSESLERWRALRIADLVD